MTKVELRSPFDKIPGGAVVVALLIDSMDIFSDAVAVALMFVFIPLGLLPHVGVSLLETILAGLAFKDPWVVIGTSTDLALPPPFDLFPNATVSVLLREGKLTIPGWEKK